MGWQNLTFTFGSTLTASDMNALHENYAATFAGNSGSPVSKFDALGFTQNDLTAGINSGGTLVLSEGMYVYITSDRPLAWSFPTTRLEFNDGSSWHQIMPAGGISWGTGLFMTYSNNFRIYNQGDAGVTTGVHSPIIYRYD